MKFDALRILLQLLPDRKINDDLDDCLAKHPEKVALTALQVASGMSHRFTYRELCTMVDRIAVGLVRLGIGRGDVVSLQVSNWWQFTATYLACSRIEAVVNPLLPSLREPEIVPILKDCDAKVAVLPKAFRGFDYEQMFEGFKDSLPELKVLVVIGGGGSNSFEALLSDPQWERAPDAREILTRNHGRPDDVTERGLNTVEELKSATRSSDTQMSNSGAMRWNVDDVVLMALPLAHQIALMCGVVMPVAVGARAVLLDTWEPLHAIGLIRAEGCTFTVLSEASLSDLTKTAIDSGQGMPSLRTVQCVGRPVSSSLVQQVRQLFGVKVI